MIFVTVGTHEQPFNRLVQYMDNLKRDGILQEEVIIQTGYSTYQPKYCTYEKMFSYQKMFELVKEARIVITHGGPSSFMMPLQIGKIPIVVPRQKKYGEHVNDHQYHFISEVERIQNNIIAVYDIECLGDKIINYDRIVKGMTLSSQRSNAQFNEKFNQVVNELFTK